jgi:hypothetical protein
MDEGDKHISKWVSTTFEWNKEGKKQIGQPVRAPQDGEEIMGHKNYFVAPWEGFPSVLPYMAAPLLWACDLSLTARPGGDCSLSWVELIHGSSKLLVSAPPLHLWGQNLCKEITQCRINSGRPQ